MDLLFQLFLIIFFIFLNGFFVMSEYALVSSRRSKIEEIFRSGSQTAGLVIQAFNSLQTYISATQFGITLASLALGWLGEPALAKFLSIVLEPHLPMYMLFISSHIIALTISFLLITFLQIIFGELAPKTTALARPEQFATRIIIPLMIFTTIFRPFINLLSLTASSIVKLFGISTAVKRSVYTEEEIKIILAQSAKGGEIDQTEVDMINRLFRLGDVPISRIAIPTKDVISFSLEMGVVEIAKRITEDTIHTRFPIFYGKKTHIVGYIVVTDLYLYAKTLAQDIPVGKTDLVKQPLSVNALERIDDVLARMKIQGSHLAIVVDKNQNMLGIVSIEDIIESLVGELREKE